MQDATKENEVQEYNQETNIINVVIKIQPKVIRCLQPYHFYRGTYSDTDKNHTQLTSQHIKPAILKHSFLI